MLFDHCDCILTLFPRVYSNFLALIEYFIRSLKKWFLLLVCHITGLKFSSYLLLSYQIVLLFSLNNLLHTGNVVFNHLLLIICEGDTFKLAKRVVSYSNTAEWLSLSKCKHFFKMFILIPKTRSANQLYLEYSDLVLMNWFSYLFAVFLNSLLLNDILSTQNFIGSRCTKYYFQLLLSSNCALTT